MNQVLYNTKLVGYVLDGVFRYRRHTSKISPSFSWQLALWASQNLRPSYLRHMLAAAT